MAKDRDGAVSGTSQSKKPTTPHIDLGDQPQQQHLHHRVKSQKHLVGGATGGRVHARIPSTKGLHKHHAATSSSKLNRKHGSLSPDQEVGLVLASHHHHRATSELKLTQDPSSSNLKKNASHANLKRNRSQVEVGKRTKSTASLPRSASSPAVDKLRRSSGSSKVQFNLGDEDQEEDQDEDEWVDASTSASPLLSRRGSAVSSAHTTNRPAGDEDSPAASPIRRREDAPPPATGTQNGTQSGTQNTANSLPRNKSSHNQYLTCRILSRTPSHGAPPMMSAETVSIRPSSSRQHSPPDSSFDQEPSLSTAPGAAAQVRPGSSGKAELTSRFVGNNSQEPGSDIAGELFIQAANRGGLSRAALNGKAAELTAPKRRQSLGALSQARGIDALNARRAAAQRNGTDDEDEEEAERISHARHIGDYAMPRDMNRTQQKLNLQRASSSLEPVHPHPGIGIGIGPPGAPGGAGSLMGVPTTYDSRDPRTGKLLERTGMEYLTVRRHLNPVARSISRVMQLPDLENSRRIPRSGGSHHHASRFSEQFNPNQQREPVTRNSSMADLIGGGNAGRRPPTPRGGASSAVHSASSSLGTDDGASRMHERRALSGTSLVNGTEDAETVSLLRMMWDKNLDLSASQD